MSRLSPFLRDQHGATAAEFAMVLPLLLILLLGIIDVGRLMWEYNRAEKATQMGVRYAVVTDMVPGPSFAEYSFAVDGDLPQGSVIPMDEFESVTCNDSNCDECVGGAVCNTVAHDPIAFGKIVERMAAFYPSIANDNVEVEYRNIGLGYAGDPNGPDVAPLVTVRLIQGQNGLKFTPITFMLFGGDITMPDFRAALTLEDGLGTVAN